MVYLYSNLGQRVVVKHILHEYLEPTFMYILVSLQYPRKIITHFQFYSCSFQRSVIISPHLRPLGEMISYLRFWPLNNHLSQWVDHQQNQISWQIDNPTAYMSQGQGFGHLTSLKILLGFGFSSPLFPAPYVRSRWKQPLSDPYYLEHHYPDQEWKTVHDLKL